MVEDRVNILPVEVDTNDEKLALHAFEKFDIVENCALEVISYIVKPVDIEQFRILNGEPITGEGQLPEFFPSLVSTG